MLSSAVASLRPPRTLCNARRLSVCLLATSGKNYWTNLPENFTTHVHVYKEELIKFWKSSASGYRNFWRILQHCETGNFFTQFGSYLRKEWSDFDEKFITDASWIGKFLLNLWNNPDPESASGVRIQTTFSLADVCGFWLLLLYLGSNATVNACLPSFQTNVKYAVIRQSACSLGARDTPAARVYLLMTLSKLQWMRFLLLFQAKNGNGNQTPTCDTRLRQV